MTKRSAIKVMVMAAVLAASWVAAGAEDRQLNDEEWAKIRKGELVSEVKNEGGTQSGAWSAGMLNHPPALVWKAIGSLELYDEYTERTTVSVLLDEATKDKVIAAGDKSADEVEKLFEGMTSGYVKKEPDGKWTVYSYQRSDLPWPVNDRWVLIEITHDDQAMKQTWKRLAGNIKTDYGYWKVVPAPEDPNKTAAINEIHLDLDIPATGPFIAFGMEVSLPDMFKGFDKMATDLAKEEKK